MAIRGDQIFAAAVLEEITQATHGFTQRQMLSHNGTNWILADASDEATRARGLVAEVVDTNTFVIAFGGLYDEESAHGLTVGEDYYLDDTPGGITLTQEGIIQHVLTVVSATAYLVKMYDPVRPAYIFDRKADIYYYGYEREDDSRWLVKHLTIAANGDVTEEYANILNNGGYATLDAAWPDRATLTYDPDQAVAERKPFFSGVTGPVGATDDNLALFNGVSGRVIKEGPAVAGLMTTSRGTVTPVLADAIGLSDDDDSGNPKLATLTSIKTLFNQLPDAPSDGLVYGRKDAGWVEASGGGYPEALGYMRW